ncbi:MAG: adenosine kinase [Hyphomicrobiales bacterium]|nr:MAG: adenosine kinase [Hyphomicrobiales bacterium]
MSEPIYDVLTIGNAIADIIAHAEDDFLVKEDITKGAMNLIDAERAEHLYKVMGPAIIASGGSAGNTAAGVASLGGKAAYFGKVSDDELGAAFTHDMRAIGVAYDTKMLDGTPPTARSIIFTTPDGERSMNTYLGACVELSPEDIEEDKVAAAQITYFEGYLWDPPKAKDAIRLAAEIAHKNGRQVAMTLSDSFCVDRYRDEFLELMTSGTVDIVFANESELKSLYQTSSYESGLDAIRQDCKLAVVTRSEQGSTVVTRKNTTHVDASPIENLVDSNGAGDAYAAGFLWGLTNTRDLKTCAKIGGLVAAEVIQHLGPRAQSSLKELVEQSGL